ncbi:uncharacterized protein A4U43_C04F2290 [Asparagus officinalis]|uniref:Uncharacterized protein n=1 Tax=Asparagus officinalis TaxID=4686 RepID=A0A5P1EY56_ASPOF|nr:uncharacterized protein A4U43_C04F2290 [Asparagus officinalis]
MLTPAEAGFLGSPFPPRSRPGWPTSGNGNSLVPCFYAWPWFQLILSALGLGFSFYAFMCFCVPGLIRLGLAKVSLVSYIGFQLRLGLWLVSSGFSLVSNVSLGFKLLSVLVLALGWPLVSVDAWPLFQFCAWFQLALGLWLVSYGFKLLSALVSALRMRILLVSYCWPLVSCANLLFII